MSEKTYPKQLNGSVKRALRRRIEYARDLVEQGWAKGVLARKGRKHARLDQDADRYCALGAIQKALVDLDKVKVTDPDSVQFQIPEETKYLEDATSVVAFCLDPEGDWETDGEIVVMSKNDSSRNKKRMLKAFDCAIEMLS